MLAVLPISLIALTCLVVGPWFRDARKSMALRGWFVGTTLIMLISIVFSLLGADQAKTGATLFIYAALLMALPGSLVLPFVAASVEPLFKGNSSMYYITAWLICTLMGWLEWKALGWLYAGIQRHGLRVKS